MVTNRPRGILTSHDREYLLEGRDYDFPQQHSEKRRKIRERIKNGLRDFSVLRQLPQNQRRKIFDGMTIGDPLYTGITDAIGFFYRGVHDAGLVFEPIIEDGIGKTLITPRESVRDLAIAMGSESEEEIPEFARGEEVWEGGPERFQVVERDNRKMRVLLGVDADISYDYTEIPILSDIKQRLSNGGTISTEELSWLIRLGIIEPDFDSFDIEPLTEE